MGTVTMADTITPKEKNPYQPRINSIRKVIYAEEKRLRAKYPILDHQDALGLAWFFGSLGLMAITGYLYLTDVLAWYLVIPLMAMYISVLHELEHDLIHELYFKEQKWIQNLMFATIWISKVNANPWWRKPMHLKHHKTSGQVDDIEERLIGLGQPLGLVRFLITINPIGSYLVMNQVGRDSERMGSVPGVSMMRVSALNLPVILPGNACLIALFFPSYVPAFWYSVAWAVCVLLYFPNMLRQSSLQLFCFNFGATHIIHHYVTRQPFYLRQMAADGVMDEFRKQGFRFNDLDIYKRAHRYSKDGKPLKLAVGA